MQFHLLERMVRHGKGRVFWCGAGVKLCVGACVYVHVRFCKTVCGVCTEEHLKLSTERKANSQTGNLLPVFPPFPSNTPVLTV